MNDAFMSPKIDLIFKELMRKDSILKGFLCAMLRLAPGSIHELVRMDPYIDPEYPGEKQSILDVRVRLNNDREIDIEIQVAPYRYWTDRCLYYLAGMLVKQIRAGEEYEKLIRCVSIGILDFVCFRNSDHYYSRFHIAEDSKGFRFSELFEFHTLELPKLPVEMAEAMMADPVYQWARFFDAESFEEVNELSQINPSIREAAEELERMAGNPEMQEIYWQRRRALSDTASEIYEREHRVEIEVRKAEERSLRQGREEGITLEKESTVINMLANGLDIPLIAKVTGLSEERIHEIALGTTRGS